MILIIQCYEFTPILLAFMTVHISYQRSLYTEHNCIIRLLLYSLLILKDIICFSYVAGQWQCVNSSLVVRSRFECIVNAIELVDLCSQVLNSGPISSSNLEIKFFLTKLVIVTIYLHVETFRTLVDYFYSLHFGI